MCYMKDWFTNYIEETSYVIVANGAIIPAEGRGTVTIEVDNGARISVITSNEVLYEPEITKNIISRVKIASTDHQLSMDKMNITIKATDGRIIAVAEKRDRSYVITNISPRPTTQESFLTTKQKLQRWHTRFAHLNLQQVRKIIGIPEHSEGIICPTCARCKITAKPFPKSKAKRATATMELIHSDLMDVTTTQTSEKECHIVTFIDDFSLYGALIL